MRTRSIQFIFLSLFFFSFKLNAQVCNIGQMPNGLRNGIVAYFPFCGNTNDISGKNNVGNANNVTFQADRFGNPNATASFSKASQSHIAFLNNPNFQQTSFTLSAWFNTNTISTGVLGSGNDQFIAGHSPTQWLIGPSYGVTLDVVNNADIFSRMWTQGTSWQDINAPRGLIKANTWYHIVLVYDGIAKNQKFYINGNLIGQRQTELSYFGQAGFFIGGSLQNAAGTIGTLFNGLIDDLGFWSRPLTDCEIQQLYTVNNSGFTNNQIPDFNPLPDALSFCGQNAVVNGPSGFSSYTWSNGTSIQNINVNGSGLYKLTVSNQQGCLGLDSVQINIVDPTIIQNDTTICKGSSITLSTSTSNSSTSACDSTQLPANLRNGLVAYYPFCGNANNALGTGNNGTVFNAVPTTDRFGNSNSAYSFNGTNAYIDFGANPAIGPTTTIPISISIWVSGGATGNVISKYTNLDASKSYFFFGRSANGYSWIGNGTNPYIQNTGVSDNEWTHYVLVGVAGTNNSKVYRNGVLIASGTLAMNTTMQAVSLLVGKVGASFPGFLNGKVDDILIYNRVLTSVDVQSLYLNKAVTTWSTGASTNSITVSPTQTTKYYVTVSDGINSCQDSITVNVVDGSVINTLSDTTRVCGTSATLTAGSGFDSYIWNIGVTTQSITPTSSGFYKVTGTKGACSVSDSTYLSLVQAKILQRDTTICKGSSITLSTSTSNSSTSACTPTQLPANLRNGLVAYYPFCGNANDASGNGNNGVVNKASLTTDRFGNSNSAFNFDGNSQYISVVANNLPKNERTISTWINIPVANYVGMLMSYGGNGICGTSYFIGINHRSSNKLMVSGHCANNETQANYIPPVNQWVNLVFVSSTSGTKIFANGNLVGSGPAFFSNTLGSNLFIGSSIDFSGINPYIDGNGLWWKGKIDDFFIWNRALNETEVKSMYNLQNSISWSTGDTTSSITVTPSQTTKYYLNVSDGITTCTDSILVKVDNVSDFNPLPDTISQCGITAKLDAGTKYSSYSWSNGESTPAIDVNIGGRYFVTVKDTLGCSASDSTYLSLVNANILQNDTVICNGGTINLSVDTVYKVINTLGTTLPINLKNDLVAYYPFNSNANDESGNGNHATVYNARLTTDRFGRANSAYSFSPTSKSSIIPGVLNTTMVNSFTYSVWVKPLNPIVVPAQGQSSNAASGFPNNTCVIHPIHGQNYGPENLNTGTGVYVGTNGVYLEEHSAGWEAVPISHQTNLTGWHLINIVYENKVPTLYIDGVFIKKGVPSPRQIYASLGPDRFPTYDRSGIGAGYIPGTGTTQYFNGDIDDIFYYKRALSANEVNQIYNGALNVKWSTGDTTSKITVSPSVTTKYFVTVSDGITTCTDSILVKVDNVSDFNPLPDTISQCGKSVVLDAGEDFQTYNWSNGATTQSISVTQGGRYNVNVKTADGCSASDTTVVSLVYVNIDNRDTIVCAPVNIKLQITDTLVSKKGGWELLIPSSSFNFSETNFREGGFDAENAKLYSILKNGSVNRFYVFDLNTNSVQTLESNSPPGEVYDYVYDFTNSRILGTRVGRDRMFTIPLTGGTWTPYGNGNFDAESYGCATYWNPVSRRPGFFGGYGFFSVKNWVWENNGNGGWQNVFANTNNCQPPKRTGQIARNKLGDKLYIFSGQGSCDGNQFASSCSISQPWATDVGVFCWLKDLWELDLNNYTFKNILPPNSPSIVNEGGFAYDYNGDVFYNVGGYKPLPTHSPATAANLDYAVEVYRYRRGLDNGFELLPVDGIKPPVLKLSQYSGRTYFDAKNNRIIWARNDGIWALNLGATGSASYKYKWSTGDSTTSITVSPTKTTTYYVNVTDGITTCSDSVTVTVEQPTNAIRYPTQDIIVNRPTELAARKFGRTYLWNPDVQLNSPRLSTPIITATKQQQYTIRITTDAGCVTVDTVLVRVFPDRNIYVPEGFTPDADGRNDRLYPIPIGIREMRTFRVYNRWGTLLYDNKNANINNGWDGTYLGTAQPMESYVWVAEGIDIDGKFIRRTGNAILIR